MAAACDEVVVNLLIPSVPSNLAEKQSNAQSPVTPRLSSSTVPLAPEVEPVTASNVTVTVFDLTLNTALGTAVITGGQFAAAVDLVTPGAHRLRVRATDAAGNTADTEFNVFVDLTPPAVEAITGVPLQPRPEPVGDVFARFTKRINPATFTTADMLHAGASYLYRLAPAAYGHEHKEAWYGSAELQAIYETDGSTQLMLGPGILMEGTRFAFEFAIQLPVWENSYNRGNSNFMAMAGLRFLF